MRGDLNEKSKAMLELRRYYDARAQEYEEGYSRDDPVFQAEVVQMKQEVGRLFVDRRVLEVACGTGVWTEVLAKVAEHVTATDISPVMLSQAHEKNLDPVKAEFIEADAFDLSQVPGTFNAGLAVFWFSHVPHSRVSEFLTGFHSRLQKGSLIFMADNTFEEGRGGKLIREPGVEDTFKLRTLSDGSAYRILKNYYHESYLRKILSPLSSNLIIHEGKWFWWVSYNIA
jgi:2-polyprenyl-3-methyl-5-hydroxy-6-metoxy-1,4-benzoquinol methylase